MAAGAFLGCGCGVHNEVSGNHLLTRYRQRIEVLMNTTVSILAEIPEELHDTLAQYLETHPDWDQDRLFAAALSLFLVQNGGCDRHAAQVYLDSLFKHAV